MPILEAGAHVAVGSYGNLYNRSSRSGLKPGPAHWPNCRPGQT